MTQQNGEWNVMDENDLNPQLVEEIGKAWHPVARYQSR